MPMGLQELTFDGGVNLNIDPHLLKPNEWQLLQNLWPYRNKLIGSRPSLVHERDVLPVPEQYWNSRLFNGYTGYPTAVPNYGLWFRHLTPLRALFLGSLEKMALICVCNQNAQVVISEQFEGSAAQQVTLVEGDVILMLTPNDISSTSPAPGGYPMIKAVRLGKYSNLTPSLVEFNGDIIAANKDCDYVVRVVKASTLDSPSPSIWPNIDYRFTKIDFGPTNQNFRADGVIVYKNRFVYWEKNKVWFSDPFQPQTIYDDAVETAYLGVFFDTGITEEITAMSDLYMSAVEEAGSSVLAVWTAHSMLVVQGEPATTIASSPKELFANCNVTRIPLTSGCISQASIVKTKYGLIWCGAESVWFMPRGDLPQEVGLKISPRIRAQSAGSAGRIFATFDEECYRLVLNSPNVGFNAYEALNEMWCLTFAAGNPSKESAAWFGPQVFTNTDNPAYATPFYGGLPGIFCCAKLTNLNDDRTWYIQPYAYFMGLNSDFSTDGIGRRLGLSSLDNYIGVDITAPFRPEPCALSDYYYNVGAKLQQGIGLVGSQPYTIDYVVMSPGVLADADEIPVYANDVGTALHAKRSLAAWQESAVGVEIFPRPYKVQIQSGNLTMQAPDLVKLVDGYELTYKTLNPVALSSWWWPWEPNDASKSNVVIFQSNSNVFAPPQNVLGGFFNEPVLTTRRVPSPTTKRYNGLTAQLNINEPDEYRIIAANKVTNPNWNIIRIGNGGINIETGTPWWEFNLFDFDSEGIFNSDGLASLYSILETKVFEELGMDLDPSYVTNGKMGFLGGMPIYIDLTAQGWEWFGFVPTNRDEGWGINIISNDGSPSQALPPTGPVPLYAPHQIHFAKLAVRARVLGARPR